MVALITIEYRKKQETSLQNEDWALLGLSSFEKWRSKTVIFKNDLYGFVINVRSEMQYLEPSPSSKA